MRDLHTRLAEELRETRNSLMSAEVVAARINTHLREVQAYLEVLDMILDYEVGSYER